MSEKFEENIPQTESVESKEMSEEFKAGFSNGHGSYGSPKNYYNAEREKNNDFRAGVIRGFIAAKDGFPDDPKFEINLEHPTTWGELKMIAYNVFGPGKEYLFEYNTLLELSEKIEKHADIADKSESGIELDEEGFQVLNCTPQEARTYAAALREYNKENPNNPFGWRRKYEW